MRIRIGFPRGLWFYDYFPLWEGFYRELGAEIIVSDYTNRTILNAGVKNTVEEACLPVKIFHGHILNLKDRVDYIFLPKIMSVYRGEYTCPKFCGLPEMVSHSIKGLPPIIDTTINFNKSRKDLNKTICKFANYLTKDPIRIRRAYKKGLENYYDYKDKLRKGYFPIKRGFVGGDERTSEITIALLGHSYNIYDNYGSMGLIEKLLDQGIGIITPEMLAYKKINRAAGSLDKQMFWTYGRKLLGSAIYLSRSEDIDGIIYLSSFGCGIDSIIQELAQREARRGNRMPFLLITVDEHTGEAGINTRLEAFIDMIEWRKKSENNLSTYG